MVQAVLAVLVKGWASGGPLVVMQANGVRLHVPLGSMPSGA